jgi:hypothetical protein
MQRSIFNRILGLALGCGSIVAVACSDDAGTADPAVQTSKQNGPNGTGSDSSQSPTPPTSNGPVVSVRVVPAQANIPLGYYMELGLVALDAKGAQVSTKAATWRSADPNIVIASDTGVMYGKALGTTKVFATLEGHTDSATVTVVPAPSNQPPPPVLASFDLNATILGMLPGSDTSKSEPIVGAVVRLSRVGGVTGDTLSQPIDAGSAVADANGAVSFKSLPGGSYAVSITPPAGSPYAALMTGFAPPRTSPMQLQFKLSRKSP